MLKVSCYLQASSSRQQFLAQTIASINLQSYGFFDRKYICVHGSSLEPDIHTLLKDSGWTVWFYETDRISAFKFMVQNISTDFIFYIEDDIELFQLPLSIYEFLENQHGTKSCGLLSLNLGGSTCNYPHDFGDLADAPSRILLLSDKEVVFLRDFNKANSYFFEFPCVFMNKNMLDLTLPYLSPGNNIEEALTQAYSNCESSFYKASMCNTEFLNLFQNHPINNFAYEMEKVKYYRILDPRQGGVEWNLSLLK